LGRLDLVVAVPVGSGMADDLPPGVYLTADGRAATVVFEGAKADPAALAGLGARLAQWGTILAASPDAVTTTPIGS
jgi:hypothetical protein